jgi:hypothetical protein
MLSLLLRHTTRQSKLNQYASKLGIRVNHYNWK